MRIAKMLGAGLALLAGVCAPAVAQRLEGRVVRAADSVGVTSVLVRLLDVDGLPVGQTSTSSGGAFVLHAPAPGRYTIAVLRIGQRPWRSAVLDLATGAVRRLNLAVPDEPITLDPISVEARSGCRTSPAEGSVVVGLLEEANKALTVTRLGMERREIGYVVEYYKRRQRRDSGTVDSVGMVEGVLSWPIRSVPAEILAAHGFVRDDGPRGDSALGGYTYYGPDATVLLSPWFLATHCFGVLEGTGADSGTVVVTFRPEGGRRADIAGRIVIAQGTLELRRIEWRYVRLPRWVDLEGAGGEMVLDRLPTGGYLPVRWWMRAPVAEVTVLYQPVRVWGWVESGGRVVLNR